MPVAAANTRLNLRQTKVLLIEDNPHALEILTQVLVGFGVSQSHRCETADEAVKTVDKAPFDLILADGEMGGQDGYAFTRHVRADTTASNFSTPIIILTACPTRAKIVQARDCGANFVIAKPIVPGRLLNRIIWIARSDREFVACETYRGPDRRFRNVPLPPGIEERRADALRMAESPERDLSQDEIDALF